MKAREEVAIEISHISKEYFLEHRTGEKFFALKDISFSVNKGDVVGIIGSNGSGKSTLLKILSQITKPNAGEVKFYGSVRSILDIGTNFHPDLTGRENIAIHLHIAGVGKKYFAAHEKKILEFSEIGEFFDRPVKFYSNGMFLRLAFSMAFYLSPDILLLDEVLSVGDEGFRLKCRDMLKQLSRDGKTILFVSHNRLEILDLSSKCIWLDAGEIKRIGQSASVLSEYFALQRDNYDGKKMVIETEKYFRENDDGTLDIHWNESNAPGNEILSMRGLSVQALSGGKILNTSSVLLKFVLNKKKTGVQVGAFFFLQDVFYQPVLVGHFLNNTNGCDFGNETKNESGLLEVRCVVPGNFLSPGKYFLLPRFGIEEGTWNQQSEEAFRFDEKLHFTIHAGENYKDVVGDSSKGAVRPQLNWEVKKIL